MSYSANDNQNYFVQSGRSTTRVLAPPGGKTSISFGTAQAPPPKKKTPAPVVDKKKDDKVGMEKLTQDTKAATCTTDTKNERSRSTTQSVSNDVFAKNGGGNVITGRPSTRVSQPPGGKSSISFGC